MKSTTRAWLQLFRVPTVFSSMSNAFAGFWLWGGGLGDRHALIALALGMVSSAFFIMAGMGLNDIADIETDRRERPKRPLPSGALSLAQAWVACVILMALGLTMEFLANPFAGKVSLVLVAAIFLYNFVFKGGWFGPLSMGLCRVFNVLAGMALTWQKWPGLSDLSPSRLVALIGILLYIAMVTFLARDEAKGNSTLRIRIFFFGIGLWLGMWVMTALTTAGLAGLWMIFPIVGWAYFVLHPLRRLWHRPDARHTGQTVGTLLKTIPLGDAMGMLAAGVHPLLALVSIALVFPGGWLAKRFYTT